MGKISSWSIWQEWSSIDLVLDNQVDGMWENLQTHAKTCSSIDDFYNKKSLGTVRVGINGRDLKPAELVFQTFSVPTFPFDAVLVKCFSDNPRCKFICSCKGADKLIKKKKTNSELDNPKFDKCHWVRNTKDGQNKISIPWALKKTVFKQ